MSVIKRLREKHKMTQEDLAKRLNVSRTAVTKWETGECWPSIDRLLTLSNVFGCSVDDLLRTKK